MGKDIMDGGTPGDYITPLLGLFGRLVNGPSYTLAFPPSSLTPHEIRRLLKRNGVRAWTAEILDGQGAITVRKADAARACQILEQHGVRVSNPPPQSQRPQRSQSSGSSPFDVFDIFD
jgi:hypothetical protein